MVFIYVECIFVYTSDRNTPGAQLNILHEILGISQITFMAKHYIPVAGSKGMRVIGEPNHIVDLQDSHVTMTFDYKFQRYLDRDKPELGLIDGDERVLSEFTIARDSIRCISVTRDEENEVFCVNIEYSGVVYEISLFFKSLKEARQVKDILTNWWLNGENKQLNNEKNQIKRTVQKVSRQDGKLRGQTRAQLLYTYVTGLFKRSRIFQVWLLYKRIGKKAA